jgi:hypothetical protein
MSAFSLNWSYSTYSGAQKQKGLHLVDIILLVSKNERGIGPAVPWCRWQEEWIMAMATATEMGVKLTALHTTFLH